MSHVGSGTDASGKRYFVRDSRPYCPPPQTVKELLERKRKHKASQDSASLLEFNQESGAVGSASFVHLHDQQPDDIHPYQRLAPQYTYPVHEGIYSTGSAALYSQGEQYATERTETQNLDANLGVVSPGSYIGSFSHAPSWVEINAGMCSAAGTESFLRMSGSVVPDMIPMDLEEARAEIQRLSPEQLLQRDEDGDTILHLYAAKGLRALSYAVAEQYLQYGRLDAKEHNGKSPLLVAVAANQPHIVCDLIMLGADVNASDKNGQTALHVAGTYGLSDILKVLLSLQHQLNIDVEARNYDGLTPLHCAVICHNAAYTSRMTHPTSETQQQEQETLTCVQLLLQLGANCTSQDIKSNKTILHLAVQAGNIPLVKFILDLPHADLHGLINMKAHGNTALHMAAALPPVRSTEYLIQLLLCSGGDPSTRNLENEQPAHLVSPGEYSEQIKLLLKRRRVMSSSRQSSSSSFSL
ncbi:NF-kappa-B inhibitor delta [Spea bombifrons]|uniref:NF-kappa-B inhibitor delta n=1 Tax=Spea bombifrons TaxID=233779 RepID=UPI00234AFB87|nr:NF-kappa-B inhibitor delta [Spea bombifrons]